MDNTDGKMSSSAGDTAQDVRTAAMTSNAESEVLSTDQGIATMCIKFSPPHIVLVFRR